MHPWCNQELHQYFIEARFVIKSDPLVLNRPRALNMKKMGTALLTFEEQKESLDRVEWGKCCWERWE